MCYSDLMIEKATLAGGCFWCTQAIFKRVRGVLAVDSGYSGGKNEFPTYNEVITDKTGHAESIQIQFDPDIISYQQILEIFWLMHDPTTLNQQGADRGTHYRSMIFYHSQKQKEIALASKEKLEGSRVYPNPVVTEIIPFEAFYKAEDYHQNYYENNRDNNLYCQIVIDPKIKKLFEKFKDRVK